jgi:hypothetical protein
VTDPAAFWLQALQLKMSFVCKCAVEFSRTLRQPAEILKNHRFTFFNFVSVMANNTDV